MKTKRILTGKIDPKTGEMDPPRPGVRKHPTSKEDDGAIARSGSDKATKDDSYAAESTIAYKKQCRALKVKLVGTQKCAYRNGECAGEDKTWAFSAERKKKAREVQKPHINSRQRIFRYDIGKRWEEYSAQKDEADTGECSKAPEKEG